MWGGFLICKMGIRPLWGGSQAGEDWEGFSHFFQVPILSHRRDSWQSDMPGFGEGAKTVPTLSTQDLPLRWLLSRPGCPARHPAVPSGKTWNKSRQRAPQTEGIAHGFQNRIDGSPGPRPGSPGPRVRRLSSRGHTSSWREEVRGKRGWGSLSVLPSHPGPGPKEGEPVKLERLHPPYKINEADRWERGWRTVQCGASLPGWCHLELGSLGLGPGSAIFPAGGLTPPSIHSFCMNGVQILPCTIQPGCYTPKRIPSSLSCPGQQIHKGDFLICLLGKETFSFT